MAVVGEEFLIGQIPSRTDPDPCDSIPEEDLPTWAQLVYVLNNENINTMEIIFVGCELASDPDTESDSGLGGWSGIVDKPSILRVPLGGTPGHPAVPITQALANTQDWNFTFPYAQALTNNGLREEMGSLIVGIVIRKIS